MLSMALRQHGHFNWADAVDKLERELKDTKRQLQEAYVTAAQNLQSKNFQLERAQGALALVQQEHENLQGVVRDFIERAQPMTEQR